MLEGSKKFELKDEELRNVNGGTGYTIGNPKPIGFTFRASVSPITYKIYEVVRYVSDLYGYEYKIDVYYNNEFMNHYSVNYYDFDIDGFVNSVGLPD